MRVYPSAEDYMSSTTTWKIYKTKLQYNTFQICLFNNVIKKPIDLKKVKCNKLGLKIKKMIDLATTAQDFDDYVNLLLTNIYIMYNLVYGL